MGDIREIRERIQRKLNVNPTYGLIGDSDGRIDYAGRPGYIWVRIPSSTGGDYVEQAVKSPVSGSVPMRAGMPVVIGYDQRDELTILSADFDAQRAAGIDPRLNNPSDSRLYGFVSSSQLLTLRCQPISTPSTDSMTVWVKSGWWIDDSGDTHWFGGETISLASSIPSSGEHVLALVYIDSTNDSLSVATSTAQDIGEAFDPEADTQECVDSLGTGDVPVWFWRLYGGQTRITDNDSYMDARQIIGVSISGSGSESCGTISTQQNPITYAATIGSSCEGYWIGSIRINADASLSIDAGGASFVRI